MDGEPFYFTLGVPDPGRAQAFYGELFGWTFSENGHITNLALCGGVAPAEFGLGPRLYLTCADVAAGVDRIRELGGTAEDPVGAASGEYASCTDDQGTPFLIGWTHPEMEAGQIAGLADRPEPRAVLGYLTLGAPDVDRAADFFGALFGWVAEPAKPGSAGGGARYRHVTSTELPLGFSDHDLDRRLHLYFRVADAATGAAEAARLGGQVDPLGETESGLSASGHDDQDMPFDIWQPAPGL